jgi:hypothetical protein
MNGENYHWAENYFRWNFLDCLIAFNFSFARFLASLRVAAGFVRGRFFFDIHTKPASVFLILKRGRFGYVRPGR